MSTAISNESYDGYCGTSYAAKMLGLSVGTVQSLVEKNELIAWKTQGGHRRISMKSIEVYHRRHNLLSTSLLREKGHLRVLVVEDDEATRLMMQATLNQWGFPLDAVMYESAVEVLLDMPIVQPDVLITDLRMPRVDGFEFLRTLNEHRLFVDLVVIVISGLSLEEANSKGGLPEGVHFMQKPIDFNWLRGFLEAIFSVRQTSSHSKTADY